jgi:TRAP-type C4-dicarboxylate transport system substrate-binding protein
MQVVRLSALGIAVSIGVAAGASIGAAAEVKLKAASFLPARAVVGAQFYRWVKEVNKRCDGKVEITVVGPESIKSLEQWRALKDGVIDMHYGPPNYYKGVLPEGDVISDSDVETAVQRANGAWAIINKLHNEKMNAWYLTHLTNGVKFYLYTRKPAVNGRFEGFRLRSVPIYDAFFKSLGAQPVRMGPPAVYTALERGTVDGYGWPLWGIQDFGWQKYTKYRYGPGFLSAAVAILVNLDKWKSLTGDQRQCLTDMAIWVEKVFPKWRAAEDKKQLAVQNKAGIKYVDLGPGFAKRANDLYWADLKKANPEVVGKLEKLLRK